MDQSKDTNWFKNINSVVRGEYKPPEQVSAEKKEREASLTLINNAGKISEEQERKIQAEMAVMFREKQEEL